MFGHLKGNVDLCCLEYLSCCNDILYLYFRNFLKEATGGGDADDFGNILSTCMKRHDIIYVICDPKWKKLRVLFTNNILKYITKLMRNDEIQNACDDF